MNHYQRLGVEQAASPQEIKAAYRRLARELHPDKNPGDKDKEAAFKELERSYYVLRDHERRAAYDKTLPSAGLFDEAKAFAIKAGQHGLDFVVQSAQETVSSRLSKKGPIGTKAAQAASSVLDVGREWGRSWLAEKIRSAT